MTCQPNCDFTGPATSPRSTSSATAPPSTQPVDGVLSYDEGMKVGYRDPAAGLQAQATDVGAV